MEVIDLLTLGCRVNQAESGSLELYLQAKGLTVNHGLNGHQVVVINTCAVTSVAAAAARKQIRRATRLNNEAKIIVCGCLGALASEELLAIPGVVAVFGPGSWSKVAAYILSAKGQISPNNIHDTILAVAGYRTRPEVKLQDGCDGKCAYCTIPRARGKSRSAPLAEATQFISDLARQGYKEIALSGIHLGRYGLDLGGGENLTKLLAAVIKTTSGVRFRLGSIEANEITPELLDFLTKNQERFCPHFHLPLQSGSARVLARMNRPYSAEFYRDTILAIKERFPSATMGSDLIIGHPGEDDEAFNETMDFLKSLPLDYLHIFPFSPREGTLAFSMPDAPSPPLVKERLKIVHAFDKERRHALYERGIGQKLLVILEQKVGDTLVGTSENYLEIRLDAASGLEPSPFQLHEVLAQEFCLKDGALYLKGTRL